jgi:hypothetical protein
MKLKKNRLPRQKQFYFLIFAGVAFVIVSSMLVSFFVLKKKISTLPTAPTVSAKTPSVDEKPELYYLSKKEVTQLFGSKVATNHDKQTRTLKTSDGKMEEFVPYVVTQENNTTQVYFRTDKGIERYTFSNTSLSVDLAEKETGSTDFAPQSVSTPTFQYKKDDTWTDYVVNGSVETILEKGPNLATITQKTKSGVNDISVIWNFGIDDEHIVLKNTFSLSSAPATTNRLLWTVGFPKDKGIVTADYEKEMLSGKNNTNKSVKLGNVFVSWNDFQEPTKAHLSAANQTLQVYFYEDGKEGSLEIDPTITTTVNSAAAEIDVEIDDGTRLWCFGKNPQEAASTRSLFQPTRFHHASISDPTNCTTGGNNLLSNNAGAAKDSPLFSGVNGWDSTTGITVRLLETTSTRARVQTYKNNTLDSKGLFTIYPNGYGFFNYDLGTANASDQTYTLSQHYLSATPQSNVYDSVSRTYTLGDTTNNNYMGMTLMGFQILGIPLMPDYGESAGTDYTQYWNSSTTTQTLIGGTKSSVAHTILADMSEYRATNYTKDLKVTDYRLPDSISDGLTNAILWDDAGEQNKYFTGFEGADSNLCGGGDGFTTGSCNGDDTAVGNDTSDPYMGTYAAKFDGGATTTDVAYAQLTLDSNPRQAVRFKFKVGTETLGNSQEMVIAQFAGAGTNGILSFRQNGSGVHVLCVTPIRGGTTGTQVCGTTALSTGTWYDIEYTNITGITAATSYGNHTQVFLNGVPEATSTQTVTSPATTTTLRLGLVSTSTANNDIYIDNVAVGFTETGIIGFNPSEGAYTLQHSNWGSDLAIDIDRGNKVATGSALKVRGWKSASDPMSVKLEGKQLINGTDYNADVLPISEAWVNDSDATCGTSGWQKLSEGGDTSDAEEYLFDTSDNFAFQNGGSGSNCTWGDSSTDALYFGRTDRFSGLNIQLATVGVSTTPVATWEYCSANTDVATACDTWSNLTVTESVTGASTFTNSGAISFTPPSQMIRSTENSGREALYFIRARLTSGSYSTYPTEQKITSDILSLQYQGTLTQDDQTFTLSTKSSPGIWKFDEGSGATVGDTSGLGNSLTISGAAWRGDGQRNNSNTKRATYLHYDGSNDFVSRTSDTDFNFGADPFSITGWFRHPVTVTGTDTILARFGSAGYKVYMNSSGNICFGTDDDSSFGPDDSACTSKTYADSTWHHFAAIRNGTVPGQVTYGNNIMIWIDGNIMGQSTTITGAGSLDTASTLYMGIDSDGTSNPWDGEIDEVRFYPYALSAAQIYADIPDPSGILVGSNPTDPLINGLIGWWKMDEFAVNSCTGGANDTCDSSGNGFDGLWNDGAVATVTSKYGLGTEYDGSGDSTSVPDNSAFSANNTNKLSVSAWVNPDVVTGTRNIISKGAASNYEWSLGSNGTQIQALIWNSSGSVIASANASSTLTATEWQQIAFTMDMTTNTLLLYRNGVQIASGTLSGTYTNGTAALRFGERADGSNDYDGKIDEVRIYNRVLSPVEMRSLYTYAPGPYGHWKFDEGTGTSVADSSGNSNTATITDGGTVGNWEAGKIGGTYNTRGHGTTEHIVTASPIVLGTHNTISFWANFTVFEDGVNGSVVGGNASGASEGYMFYIDNTSIYSRQANGSAVSISNPLSVGTWYHLAVVRDGTSVRFYQNGVQIGATQTMGADNAFVMTAVTNFGSGTQSFPLEGRIDDVRAYNYAHTPAQIVEDMNAGHPSSGGFAGSPLMHWKLDEQNGTTINNTGNGGSTYNGTLSGMSWRTASSCKSNGCLEIPDAGFGDPPSGNISAGDVEFLDSDTSFTASMYLNPVPGGTSGDTILSKWDSTSQNMFAVQNISTDEIRVYISSSASDESNYYTTSDLNLTSSTWQHVAVVYDGTQAAANRVRVYKNGKQVSGSVTGTIPTSLVSGTTSAFKLGAYTTFTAYKAYYDDFKFYTGALNSDQIMVDANFGASMNIGTGQDESAQPVSGADSAPVAHWSLDENTGTSTSKDISGNNRDLTLTAMTDRSWVAGKYGSALSFPGVSTTYASASDHTDFTPTSAGLTISSWFNQASQSSGFTYIATKGAASNWEWYMGFNGAGLPSCAAWAADGSVFVLQATSSTAVSLNQWYHMECVIIEGSRLDLYVNGVLTASDTGAGAISDGTSDVYIGKRSDAVSNEFEGYLDDIKIYNYARLADQVAYDYNRGKAMHAYRLDECTGTTLNDVGGALTTSNGTLTVGASGTNTSPGTCTTVNTATAWYNGASGKYSGSIRFDGTDDYADLGDLPNTETKAKLSWSFWVKPNTLATAKCIFCKANSAATQQAWAFRTDASTSTTLRVAIPTGTTDQSTYGSVATALSNSTWTHVTAVFDGTGAANADRLKIYINGKLANTTYTGTIPATTTATTSSARIGSASDNADFFNGQVDEVQVFSYPLSLIQVQKMFNQGAGVRFGPVTGSP